MPGTKHAILSPSASHIWLKCTKSPRLCENLPDQETDYARQGTEAHKLCQYKLEKALGASLRQADGTLDKVRLASLIFSDIQARETLEGIVYPVVLQDYRRWLSRQKAPFVIIESALILSKPLFDGIYDAAVLVEAPQEVRLQRVMRRENATREDSLRRMEAQAFPMDKVDAVITNDGTKEQLSAAVEHLFFDRNSYLCKILED